MRNINRFCWLICRAHLSGRYTASTFLGVSAVPKLTAKLIGDISKPRKGQVIYRDDEVKGFGLRVTAGSKSYIVECRVDGKAQRRTLGRADLMTPEQARLKATEFLRLMTAGRDRRLIPAPTLSDVLESYVVKKRLRESTIVNYRQALKRHLSDWLPLPVTAITKDMVFARHRELGERVSTSYANLIMATLRAMLYHAADAYETPHGEPIIAVDPVSYLSKNQGWFRKRRRQGVIPDHKLEAWYRAVMALRVPMSETISCC